MFAPTGRGTARPCMHFACVLRCSAADKHAVGWGMMGMADGPAGLRDTSDHRKDQDGVHSAQPTLWSPSSSRWTPATTSFPQFPALSPRHVGLDRPRFDNLSWASDRCRFFSNPCHLWPLIPHNLSCPLSKLTLVCWLPLNLILFPLALSNR